MWQASAISCEEYACFNGLFVYSLRRNISYIARLASFLSLENGQKSCAILNIFILGYRLIFRLACR